MLKIVAAEAPELPFFYYNIPSVSQIDFPMADLLNLATSEIPTLVGVKYVELNLADFAASAALRTCKFKGCDSDGRFMLFWAPNPKAQGLPFGARGFVLAQSYLAQWDREIYNAWPNETQMWKAQDELTEVSDMWSQVGGGSDRYILDMLNVPIGPPRLPEQPLSSADYDKLKSMLTKWGFFDKVHPYAGASKSTKLRPSISR